MFSPLKICSLLVCAEGVAMGVYLDCIGFRVSLGLCCSIRTEMCTCLCALRLCLLELGTSAGHGFAAELVLAGFLLLQVYGQGREPSDNRIVFYLSYLSAYLSSYQSRYLPIYSCC